VRSPLSGAVPRRLLGNLALVVGGTVAAIALLGAVELGLRVLGIGSSLPRHDPFAGFSTVVPMFERTRRGDGVEVYRVTEAREVSAMGHLLALEPQREFLAEKAPGTFRVFILGDSSAAGVPYGTSQAFSTWLARRLEAELPQVRSEVINAALPGYATRRLLIVAREVAGYAPDLVIVYNGHNEFAEGRFYKHLLDMDPRVFRLWETLANTRLWRLLSGLVPRSDGSRSIVDPRTEGREMFALVDERAGGRGYATARERAYGEMLYRFNLQEIVRAVQQAGARAMLLTIGQNFSDWPPAASAHRDGLAAPDLATWTQQVAEGDRLRSEVHDCQGALTAYGRALAIDDAFGELHFRIAQCQETLGRFEEARAEYRRASDLDQVPQGAPTSFNQVIRDVAATEGALLADVDETLTAESPHGLVGDDLFVDSVHPSIRGHQLMARTIADALRAAGLPVPPVQWRVQGYTDPTPEALYAADPGLRPREYVARMAMCLAAHRKQCALDAMDAAVALNPADEGLRRLRDSIHVDAARWE
jgi:lysophospholipase L1-like esterase